MKRCLFALATVLALGSICRAEPARPDIAPLLAKPASDSAAAAQAARLLTLLTPEERFDLTCGTGYGTCAIPRLGLPALNFLDSTAGVRLLDSADLKLKTTAFPAPVALAATWNPKLAERYAKAVGQECRTIGVHFLLGPGVNIYRVSLSGRNFEYFGEDPLLASHMVSAYVTGLQSVGVVATIKHFLCNNHEFRRRGANVIVDERTLHEIYLPAFQAGIDAGSHALMTSYNQVNGEWPAQSHALMTGLLREQMKFDGLAMTDWTAVWDGELVARSGVDLEMPHGSALKTVRDKLLGSPEIDRMARSILQTGITSGVYELESQGKFLKPSWIEKYPAHVEIARQVNDEGIVLLKNTGILPLDPKAQINILVTGNNAQRLKLAGGGAAHVKGYDLQSYAQATPLAFPQSKVTYAENPTDDQLRTAGIVIIFTGYSFYGHDYDGEANDRSFDLPEDALVAHCSAQNPKTIVCLSAGGGVRMDWADHTAAIIHNFYGGQTGAPALMDILTGRVNPSGKLPFSIEKNFKDSPAFGYQEAQPNSFNYTSPLLQPDLGLYADPVRKSYHTYDVKYAEGVFVGYRWYQEKNLKPRYPFGHGLSYTTFQYKNLNTKVHSNTLNVSFRLKNTGARAGQEVAQVYIGQKNPSVPRPARELKGFQKVALPVDAADNVTISIPLKQLAFWDVKTHEWFLEPGSYSVQVGSSSEDIRLQAEVVLKKSARYAEAP